ncbi:cof-like hydrolase [Bacillus cereus BAG1X1-3]|nr:cof-like hydrolase [Bacillus cereus BAG1X1-3]EOO75863.1 cof-like hydrolase [Bacillus cereus BAG1O-1]PEX38396.1 HAD family hydrolase [Bacillus cereus]PFM24917.1 HAD family hydrolase [Bacillus cereus]PFP81109.1 HAD family hydrolase [Bacillus cereus]
MKFVFDLDGTICFKGQPISERLLVTLEKLVAQGHEVIFASARPIRDLLPVLHERFHEYPMIGGNGSMIAIKGKIISTISFDEETLANIVQLIKNYNASYLIDGDWDYAYTGSATHPILNNLDPEGRAKNVKLDKLQSIVKILLLTLDNMEVVEEQLSNMNIVVHSHGNEGILDISPNGIDKWSGLQQLGVEEEEYIAFGNDANDITMFQHALYSVMIGESLELAPFSSEQLVLSDDVENILVQRINELGNTNIITKLVNI